MFPPGNLYRIADKYNDKALKRTAKEGLLRVASSDNVLQCLGHEFTAFFPEFIKLYKDYALDNWPEVTKAPDLASAITVLLEREDTRLAYVEILQNTVPSRKKGQ